MFQRVLAACAVALLLVCVPSTLTAQDKEAVDQASVVDWLAGLWNEVTDWFTGEVADGTCSLDPNGCPRGEAAQPATGGDGRCAVDPNGCPGGA